MSAPSMEGKVAIVTGAGGGIGRAAALAFARERARVLVNDVNADGAQETAKRVRENRGDATVCVADVATEAGAKDLVQVAIRDLGGVDYLHNNAAILIFGRVTDTSLEDWNRTLSVNLTSYFLCAREAIPWMQKRGGGAIVNMASVHSFATARNYAAYAASKGGVLALTRQMALDYAPEIRVNCICPGAIDTPMLRAAIVHEKDPAAAEKAWAAAHALNRLGKPEEIAEAVVWLCSDRSSFVTGAAFALDGGMLAALSPIW